MCEVADALVSIGKEKGREEGREEERNNAIRNLVKRLRKVGCDNSSILESIMEDYNLSEEEAAKYLEQKTLD